MSAAKFRPTAPSTTTVPPVMYSHPWSEQPSTTVTPPELRTAKRWPTVPARKTCPPVAPYMTALPAAWGTSVPPRRGTTTIRPPPIPLTSCDHPRKAGADGAVLVRYRVPDGDRAAVGQRLGAIRHQAIRQR